ncbi:MAG: NAD-dependent epimerase/dehydratase family protein [Candidatus Aenigmatarchaeota archaeon]
MNWKDKKIFVSGGAGVIGRVLVKKLSEKGAKILVGDLKPKPKEFSNEIIYRQGDLNYITKEELEKFSPEIFFHLAASFERSLETKEFFNENFYHNTLLSHHLVKSINGIQSLKKIIFASSYLVYNPKLYCFKYPPQHPVKLKETSEVMPRNLCGAAKLYHELELLFLRSFKPHYKIICARIFRVYGKDSRDVISRWIRELIEGREIELYREEGRFDYIFADDVAEGLIKLAESSFCGIVNLGSGRSRQVKEVIQILEKFFPTMKVKKIKSNIPFEASEADMTLFKKITNWEPTIQLEEGIQTLVTYYRNHDVVSTETSRINILVTSISNKVPLLNAVKDASIKIGNKGKIFGADLNLKCIGKFFVDKFWKMPQIEKLRIDEFIKYCRKNQISCVIPTRDGELLYFAKYKKYLEKNGIKVMISNYNSILDCIDKLKFYCKLNSNGLPVPKTSNNIEEIKAKRYVVKERFGAGSRGIGLNLTKNEAINHAITLKNPVFQPFIKGDEFSVDLYISQNGKVKGVIVRKREVVIGGESKVTSTVEDKKIEQICIDAAKCLNLYGHIMFQVIKNNKGKNYIIECNPRFGGASTLSIAAGLDSFYWFLLEVVGENIDHYPFIYIPKKLVRYSEDKIFNI